MNNKIYYLKRGDIKMKSIFKKVNLFFLALILLFGTSHIALNKVSGKSIENKYVISDHFRERYYPRQGSNYSRYYESQSSGTSISLPIDTEKSENWAGYIDTPKSSGTLYKSVSGSWTVPSISTSKGSNASAAQWIGLGGSSSSDLLQMGTIEEIQKGQPVAVVFWEKLPNVAQNITTIPVNSTISASIYRESSFKWNLTFTAVEPNGEKITKTIQTTLTSSYENGIGTSAEWINEDPSNENSQLYPLADTGTVKFENAKVNGKSLNDSSNTVQPIAMEYSNGSIAIYPSSLGADGESFTTTTNINQTGNFTRYSRNEHRNPRYNFHFQNSDFNDSKPVRRYFN